MRLSMAKELNVTVLPLSHRGKFLLAFFFQGRGKKEKEREREKLIR